MFPEPMFLIKCSSETSVISSIDDFSEKNEAVVSERTSRNLLDPSDCIRDNNRMYSFPWRRRSTASHIPPHFRIRIDRRLRFEKLTYKLSPDKQNISLS